MKVYVKVTLNGVFAIELINNISYDLPNLSIWTENKQKQKKAIEKIMNEHPNAEIEKI
tara:strand:+ start:170 stop:343 length:174 start_codon:yes stop_codon:yes gene_type:complete